MDKSQTKYKSKNKKVVPNTKPKTTKKRKSDDGPTCSMFLAELTRKLAIKKRQEQQAIDDAPKNVVQTIIDSLTNALPIKFSRKSPPKSSSPTQIVTLQTLAPELIPCDVKKVPPSKPNKNKEEKEENESEILEVEVEVTPPAPLPMPVPRLGFKMPKMPIVGSEVFKAAIDRKRRTSMANTAMNTSSNHDVASELVKHVNTLRKISLIAEEFNQKTAKNLKEIVDSVQQDLIKKLEEIETVAKISEKALNEVSQNIEE